MGDTLKPNYRYKVKVQLVPNYGLVYMPDRELQKQLDDLNEMRRIKNIKTKGKSGLEES